MSYDYTMKKGDIAQIYHRKKRSWSIISLKIENPILKFSFNGTYGSAVSEIPVIVVGYGSKIKSLRHDTIVFSQTKHM